MSDIDGRSEVQVLPRKGGSEGDRQRGGKEVVSGFVGRVRYVCDHGTADEAAAFDALMAFAGFAGVGSHTTFGFGVIEPEPTWQPPSTRS